MNIERICSVEAWLINTPGGFVMPAIVEFPQVVADALEGSVSVL
jgi:hypothetical protein